MSLALIIQDNSDLARILLLLFAAGVGCGVCLGVCLEPRRDAGQKRKLKSDAAGMRSADELAREAWQAALAMREETERGHRDP